jgi:site-specific recombinase XerD
MHYRNWNEQAIAVVGLQDPSKLTKQDLAKITLGLTGGRNSLAVKLRAVRCFLRWCGNKEAMRWRINFTQSPKVGGVFMSESQVAQCRQAAESLGPVHSVIYSLGVDMGLRPVDMCRLTMQNVSEFLSSNGSMIRGKGRNGGKVAYQKANRYARQYLERYLEYRSGRFRDGPFLMLKNIQRIRAMDSDDVLVFVNQISQASGVRFKPHDMRRTFGHRLWLQGVELETIALLMRHEKPDVTFKCYIGVTEDRLSAAMDKLAPTPMSQSKH